MQFFVLILAIVYAACIVIPSVVEASAQRRNDVDDDETVLFQRNVAALVKSAAAPAPAPEADRRWPIMVPLRRESVPVVQKGKTVSFKTSYSGKISLGRPAQDFRVVFDTGSGHVVVPSAACASESCLVHERYNLSRSSTSRAINVDGTEVGPEDLGDQATIGYGTGKVTGEFARDVVCVSGAVGQAEACVEVGVVMAVEMTAQPFKSFNFDGIFGMSLDALAVAPEFSYFNRLAGAGLGAAAQFGVFLAGGDETNGPNGEIALGGYNSKRLLSPLSWVPVAKKEMGFWQVQIKEVRIGNVTLDMCKDGSCRGIVDTGTSHLGVPGKRLKQFTSALAAKRAPGQDCRYVDAPNLELVVEGFTLSLTPENYMAQPARQASALALRGADGGDQDARAPSGSGRQVLPVGASGTQCAPRIMPVNFPEPLGPNLFILGEPVLSRYYTVYDWQRPQIGFGLAASRQNGAVAAEADAEAHLGVDSDFDEALMEVSLMQVSLTVSVSFRSRGAAPHISAAGCGAGGAPALALAEADDVALRPAL